MSAPSTSTSSSSVSDTLDFLRANVFRDITWDKLYYGLSGYVHYRSQTVPHISIGTIHELEMNFILLESGTTRSILVTRPAYAFRWNKDDEQPSPLTPIPYFPWNKPCVSPAADASAKVYIGHLHSYLKSVYYPGGDSYSVGAMKKPIPMKTRTSSPPPGFTSKQS